MQARLLAVMAGIVAGLSVALGVWVLILGVVILIGITRREDNGHPLLAANILEALISIDLMIALVAGWLVGRWVLQVLHRQGFSSSDAVRRRHSDVRR